MPGGHGPQPLALQHRPSHQPGHLRGNDPIHILRLLLYQVCAEPCPHITQASPAFQCRAVFCPRPHSEKQAEAGFEPELGQRGCGLHTFPEDSPCGDGERDPGERSPVNGERKGGTTVNTVPWASKPHACSPGDRSATSLHLGQHNATPEGSKSQEAESLGLLTKSS